MQPAGENGCQQGRIEPGQQPPHRRDDRDGIAEAEAATAVFIQVIQPVGDRRERGRTGHDRADRDSQDRGQREADPARVRAAQHTRRRVKEKAAGTGPPDAMKNKHPPRNGWPLRSEAAGHAPADTRIVTKSNGIMRHPHDTHRPHGPDNTKGLNHVFAAQALNDLVRPKGLQPLTF
ncbi:hypothetical protein GCM10010172_87470 [Paractinoplanes ferrugineus]|uniref:Uncharacterized protein n=1 Tax=Paractinoplanes ferrugineus TaxID=113564 RepID=A0A919JAZ7_9ACTN|nr:hypothetical protein Afe05nite_83620 [Actinoplanes ferrugineus]